MASLKDWSRLEYPPDVVRDALPRFYGIAEIVVATLVLGFLLYLGYQAPAGGDLSSGAVDLYHLAMIPAATLLILFGSQAFSTGYGLGPEPMYLVGLMFKRRGGADAPVREAARWATVVAVVAALLAVLYGVMALMAEFHFPFGWLARWNHESVSTLLGNLVTSHSHTMLPAVMGGTVALTAQIFAPRRSQRAPWSSGVIDAGLWVAAAGMVAMAVVYLISGLGPYVIPTLWAHGTQGVEGLAMDDSLTGVVGFGSLIVAVGLLAHMFAEREASTLRLATIASWLSAIVGIGVYGYYIEFHENFFGAAGALPKAPGTLNDAMFTEHHIVWGFFLMPIVAMMFAGLDLVLHPGGQRPARRAAAMALWGMVFGLIGMAGLNFSNPHPRWANPFYDLWIVALALVVGSLLQGLLMLVAAQSTGSSPGGSGAALPASPSPSGPAARDI